MKLTKSDMEKMALDLRERLGTASDEALDPFDIQMDDVHYITTNEIEALDPKIKKHLDEDGSGNWSAMTVPLDSQQEQWAILLNRSHDMERQRVSLLEELWHIMQGHKLVRIVRVGDGFGRSFEEDDEHDAFYLASATLLPEGVVKKMVKDKLKAEDTAKKYGTSVELVEYRVKRLGLWSQYKGKEIKLTKRL